MSDQQRVVILDTETTGTDPDTDQIIELTCRQGVQPDAPFKTWRIKPDVEISAGAQQVHGISAEDLADSPRFAQCADEIAALLHDVEVIIGYNVDFDLRFITREFARLGRDAEFLGPAIIVDPMELWTKLEPRTLQSAYRRFVGQPMPDAHTSCGDVDATCAVLAGITEVFELQSKTWAELQEVCFPNKSRWIGSSDHVQWSDSGVAMLCFGKHKGRPLLEVAEQHSSYLEWVLKKDFPRDVHDLIRGALKGMSADEFHERVAAHYGGPAKP